MKENKIIYLLFGLFFLVASSGCSSDGECLAHGENCSQTYIDLHYDGVRPNCCNSDDVCQSSPSGYYLTCN